MIGAGTACRWRRRTARLGLAALAASSACATARDPVPVGSVPVRAMSYNIAAGGGDLDAVAAVIRAAAPDIVALQEVDVRWSERSGFTDQAAALGEALGMHVRFGPIYELPPARRFGLAILSRTPIVEFTNHVIPRLSTQTADPEPVPLPGFLEAVTVIEGVRVHVFNTHLDYRADPRVREQQVRAMLELMRADTDATVLMGDLNATPAAPELRPLFERLRDAWPREDGRGLTYPARAPERRIDYILLSPHFSVVDVRVPAAQASDHLPVVADLRVRQIAPATQWKGNLHTHSVWSDGTDYPEMIVAWYRANGYDFLALTEHDLLAEGERWVDVNAPDEGWPPRNESARRALPGYRERFGAEWVQERRDGDRHLVRLRPLEEYRTLFEQPGRFLLLQGEEITDREGAHVNAFNLASAILPQGGSSTGERIRNNLAAVEEQRVATGRAIVAIVNHPNFVWSLTAEELAAIPHARILEVFNGHVMVNNAGDSLHAGTERIWDVALALRHAAGLPPLFAAATDDAHDYRAYSDTISRPGRGWVMVRAPQLASDAIAAALRTGDFYASTGVTIRSEQRDRDGIRIEIEPEAGVVYRTQFIGTRMATSLEGTPVLDAHGDTVRTTRTYDDAVGEILAEVTGVRAEYAFRGDERYVRARVVSSRPHVDPTTGRIIGRQTAWLQPVFR